MPSASMIFGGTIDLLERSLNLRSAQHRVVSANVANADTPHYKAFEVAVAEELRKERPEAGRVQPVRTHPGHLPVGRSGADRVTLKTVPPPGLDLRADGNTVDLDRAMGSLSENAIQYKASAQFISRKFKGLKNVISGGKP
ncbi:MAG: flagellar basal body rod protein FlgB [Desulfobacterales bacterium]|jgi:flagellar basal-body rod protein FlgB|nr:flagellar basal body rod protein FlgB [Desulfobacterales bacterium]